MGLQEILEAIRAAGDEQVREIEARSAAQVYQILANARLEAEEAQAAACEEAAAPVVRERARILHRARLEALQIVGSVREALVDAAFERIRGHLAGLRTDQSYPLVLAALAQEALDEIRASLGEAGKIDLEVDGRDRSLIEKTLLNMDLDYSIQEGLECWGGLAAKSEDGRVVVINTLEARLERATPALRPDLAAAFEQEQFDPCPTTTMATPACGR